MLQYILAALVLTGSTMALSQENKTKTPTADSQEPSPSLKKKKSKEKKTIVHTTRSLRKKSDVWLVYSPVAVGLLLPSKTAYSAGWLVNPDWDIYVEYIKGDIGFKILDVELVRFYESIMSINSRWYFGFNSFYLMTGLGQRTYQLKFGDDQLSDFKLSEYPLQVEFLNVKTPVLNVGIGNRWVLEPFGYQGLTIGMDWLMLHIPIAKGSADAPILDYVDDDSSASKINDVMTVLRYLPTATIKLDLGWTF